MATRGKPEIRTGQSLDVQPGVSNIGENQATLEALRNANIDGQDVFPQSVSTRRFSAEDGAFSGNMYAGSLLVGANGVTVTSGEPGQANPGTGLTTGLSITSSGLYLFKSSVTNVFLDGATGDASITGAITATSGSFTGSIYATDGYFIGSITIGTDASIGVAATGLWITNERILMKKSGTTKVDINTATSVYYFAGEIVASKITITSNAANSVNFGTNITIGGNIVINTSAVDGQIIFDGSTTIIDYYVAGVTPYFGFSLGSSSGYIGFLQGAGVSALAGAYPNVYIGNGSIILNNSGASGPNPTTRDIQLAIGTNAGNIMSFWRGSTTVMSFVGNANTVTFAGNVIAGAGADYLVTGPDATTPLKINQKLLSVSVTGTGNFGTGTWTHGWDTSSEFVSFSATLMDFDTTKSTDISNVRVERTSSTTCKVEFLVGTYASTQTIYVDVIAVGPV